MVFSINRQQYLACLFISILFLFETSALANSLTVNIVPNIAIEEGGQWRIDGGEWLDSGSTLTNVLPGSEVEFKPISGWDPGLPFTVTAENDQTLTKNYLWLNRLELDWMPSHIAYYPLDGSPYSTLEEGFDGGWWYLGGPPLYDYGRYGLAASFDGVDDFIDLPETVITTVSGSVSLWFNPRENQSSHVFSSANTISPAGTRRYISILPTNVVRGTFVNTILGEAPIVMGGWNHAVLTWDSSQSAFYVNGNLVGFGPGGAPSPQNVNLGSYGEGMNSFFAGLIDEVRIYNSALTLSEIQELYHLEPNSGVVCTDSDNDGYSIEGGDCGEMDCNDSDPAINPSAGEICGDSIDQDCNGTDGTCLASEVDYDNDGFFADTDCDDHSSTIHPGAEDICGDTIDQDCDGVDAICSLLPNAPELTCATNGLNVSTSWQPVADATGYTLYYAPYPFTGPESIGSLELGQDTNFSIDLWEGAAYYVAVEAYSDTGRSGYSNIEQFEIYLSRNPSSNQAVLGPLSGAEISIYRFSDLENPVEGPVYASESNNLNMAGSFEVFLDSIPDAEWLLVKVSGGTDIDPDDDGLANTSPISNNGTHYCPAKASDLRAGEITINPLCDFIYQAKKLDFLKISENGDSAITETLDELASYLLADINQDGSVTYKDILFFNPIKHQGQFYGNWASFIDNYVSLIHEGSPQFFRDEMVASLSTFLLTPQNITDIDGKTFFHDIETDNDGNIAAISHVTMSDKEILQTRLQVSENQILGNTNLTIDGKQINVDFVSDLQTLSEETNTLLDSAAFDVSNNGNEYIINIPKTLFQSWAESGAVITINDEEYSPEIIDDDPIVKVTLPEAAIFDYVRPYNVRTGQTGRNAYDFDVPFWNEYYGNTMRWQVYYYVNYNFLNDSDRNVTITTNAYEDDGWMISDTLTAHQPKTLPPYKIVGAGSHTNGVSYIFGPQKWIAYDYKTGERIAGNATSAHDVDYFNFSWTKEYAQLEKDVPFLGDSHNLDINTWIHVEDNGVNDTNENMSEEFPGRATNSEVNVPYKNSVVTFDEIGNGNVIYYDEPLNLQMTNKYWGDGKDGLRLTFKCDGVVYPIDSIDIPSDGVNYGSTSTFSDSHGLGYDEEKTGCTFRLFDESRVSGLPILVGESALFDIRKSELVCTDADTDRFFVEGGECGAADCNDNDDTIYPGAVEIPDDGIDQDCDGTDAYSDPFRLTSLKIVPRKSLSYVWPAGDNWLEATVGESIYFDLEYTISSGKKFTDYGTTIWNEYPTISAGVTSGFRDSHVFKRSSSEPPYIVLIPGGDFFDYYSDKDSYGAPIYFCLTRNGAKTCAEYDFRTIFYRSDPVDPDPVDPDPVDPDPVCPGSAVIDLESNDSRNTAQLIKTCSEFSVFTGANGNVNHGDDWVDYYYFIAPTGASEVFLGITTQNNESGLALEDSTGSSLWFSGWSFGTSYTSPASGIPVTPGQTYYVSVHNGVATSEHVGNRYDLEVAFGQYH